jgi:hypothetical protein
MQLSKFDLLSRACRIFLSLAYPEGEHTIPTNRGDFLRLDEIEDVESVLKPPVCQTLLADDRVRGYAFRLGSAHYPHLKLQFVNCDQTDTWVFAVDTHDGVRLSPEHPDAARYAQLQAQNRRLKESIEHALEADGLLTFNALLRRDLDSSKAECVTSQATDSPTF